MLQNTVQLRDDASVYEDVAQRVGDHFDRSVSQAPSADDVVDAILHAARSRGHWPVHILVGDDALALLNAQAASAEEQWAAAVKNRLRI